jgi:peptide/nickel transport system permease protein
MLTYLVRRLLIAIPVLFGILLISFVFVRLLPGDPMQVLLSPEQLGSSPEFVAQRRAELGLDDPVTVQYVAWVREVFQGNLGYSFHRRVPVTEMIGDRVGPTLLLTSAGVGLALLIGVPVGVFAALKQNSWVDYLSAAGSMLAISIPNFFLGLMAIYVFALWLGWLPTGGMGTLGAEPTFLDTVSHLALPAGVLSAVLLGPYVRYTRQSMLEVLRQDYITTANAKGVSRPGVTVFHALRNALVPLTTVLAIQIPALLAGTVIIETIFSWPGVGRLVLVAITSRDYPVILGVVLMSALLVMIFNLLADVAAAILDPRIRL